MKSDAKIVLIDDEGNEVDFYVISEAKLAGRTYLLVSDEEFTDDGAEDEDASTALILCAKNDGGNEEDMIYEIVDDEDELNIVSKYFEELDDIDII